jgi:hypothetical protein
LGLNSGKRFFAIWATEHGVYFEMGKFFKWTFKAESFPYQLGLLGPTENLGKSINLRIEPNYHPIISLISRVSDIMHAYKTASSIIYIIF